MVKHTTLAEEYQQLIYGLFKQGLFSMNGLTMENKEGLIEEFIPKSEFIEKSIEILNEFGRLLASDRRFTNEIDSRESNTVLEKTETP